MVYRRVSLGMLHHDKVLLALLLMRIVLKGTASEPSYQLEVLFSHCTLSSCSCSLIQVFITFSLEAVSLLKI